MSLTITYDPVLARVRIAATGLAAADVASIERSTDQIQWTMCRGGSALTVTAGALALTFDDYEFVDGVINYYRVSGIETGAISFVSASTPVGADNASLNPTLPASLVVGDKVFIFATTRGSGTGTVNTPANWSVMRSYGTSAGVTRNGVILGREYDGVWTMPTVTFAGGAAGDTNIGTSFAFRRASLNVISGIDQLNGSSTSIVIPGLAITEDEALILDAIWYQDDWSSVATPSGFVAINTPNSTLGNDASQGAFYQIQTTAVDIASTSVLETGAAAAISRSMVVALAHADYLNQQTGNITPDLDGVWIKSLRFPFLNRKVNVLDFSDITRQDNNGIFHVLGRTLPVAVTDARGSREWTMTIWAETLDDAADLDTVLASGDLEFIHVPIDCPVPGGYVVVGTTTERKTRPHAIRRHFDLPLTEVATPKQDSVGASSTWQTVLDNYATWADLIADKATWADVLELIGDASEVIVP